VLHKVSPVPVGPRFMPIPVRIIVGSDGSVTNVHVIHATDDQRRSIEMALYQWKLKPYRVEGRASPIETGLLFKFRGDS
jgi:outer membrane biosynthesis protein TonB